MRAQRKSKHSVITESLTDSLWGCTWNIFPQLSHWKTLFTWNRLSLFLDVLFTSMAFSTVARLQLCKKSLRSVPKCVSASQYKNQMDQGQAQKELMMLLKSKALTQKKGQMSLHLFSPSISRDLVLQAVTIVISVQNNFIRVTQK